MFDKDNKFGFINNNNDNSNNNIEGLDKVKTDINNIKDDLGDEELTTTNKDVKGAINEVNAQYKDIVNNKADKNELQVQKNRIDTLTTLTEGSTTGDAELIDGRVGYDGAIHDNLGNSIREQIKSINSTDFSKNIFNSNTVVKGKFRSSANGSEKDNANYSYNLVEIEPNTDYIMTGSDFDMQFFDANMNFLGYSNKFKGNNVVFSCDKTNVKYVAINISNTYDTDTYMVCKGTEMPSSFEKYGLKKLKKDITVDYSQIINAPTINSVKIYTVGTNGQYKTFTEMLRALKGDISEKIVYIERGTYDIFEEMGGVDFTTRINSDDTITNWKQCCDIVPNNTKLIGVGEVILKYKPTANQTNSKCASLISPLNIMGNVYVENITVEATNCRYSIHQENSAGLGYDSVIAKMKNVKATKWLGSYGNPQVFGSGIGKDSNWEFDNCEFYSDMPHIWTVHTNEPKAGHSASIIMNNCIIDAISPSETTKTREMIRFITGDEGTNNPAHNKVKMNNCYVGGKLTLAYDGKLNTIYNSWDLLLNNVHTESEEVYNQFAGNNYTIKKYTY